MEKIEVLGAKVHNLKNIDVEIPREKLTVVTGLSGSGKSSLAFDTIYAEGQRRYMETLSSYSRQFVGSLERPDVEQISGLSPVIAIEQKSTNKNPRSTVGTVTEINDFLRLLFAKASTAYSPKTGEKMVKYSRKEIVDLIIKSFDGQKCALMSPIVKGRKGHYQELFISLTKKGFVYARIDGIMQDIATVTRLDRYKTHNIELVVDRLPIKDSDDCRERLLKSVEEAFKHGKGTLMIYDYGTLKSRYFSRNLMCPTTGESFNEPAPHSFSFNSPHGACPRCNGLGEEVVFDIEKIVPSPNLSIAEGAIEPLGKQKKNMTFLLLEALGKRYGFELSTPFDELDEDSIAKVVYGDSEPLKVEPRDIGVYAPSSYVMWEGVVGYIEKIADDEKATTKGAKWKAQFVNHTKCSLCGGTRLNQDANYFKIDNKNIGEVCSLSLIELKEWIDSLSKILGSSKEGKIAVEIIKEISERLTFLLDVGLGYLSLSRGSATLSGGESQRIRLATQIGTKLVNVLYILDEPSIGLHQRDNQKLIDSLLTLRDAGNSVIVVEHDEDMMHSADWIVDIGEGAGVNGGKVSAIGTYDDILASDTLTADYLSGRKKVSEKSERRQGNGKEIVLYGARGNNLKNVTVSIPLGKMVCVTGVSGSGKSSLINGTLRPILSAELYRSLDQPLEYDKIEGIENIDKLIVVDQQPIGRTPRSNPATYTNLFGDIRKLFEQTTDAKIRGFKQGRFSFNVKGGRCEECKGAGVQSIEMNFLPNVYVTCPVCRGMRYNRETLAVKFKGKNINDVLNMTVSDALKFFDSIPNIADKLRSIESVGLGYLTLGQPSTTLSGGESQRIKLATELSKRDSGKTLYIFDEPTTGLHFEDIRVLLGVLDRLVDKGNTVVIIEHNLDVIRHSDYIIDIGAEGGRDGGEIVVTGTPEQVAASGLGYTGRFI
ncbi:MAG: excinuclease ABC subunit UvrA [Rikenellaceae bacterium]